MTIQLDGTTVSTTMRTPGHDFELAVGFCHTEGLLAGAPVTGVRYCATGRRGRDRVQRRHRRDRRVGARADAAPRHHVVELRVVRQRSTRRHVRRGWHRCRADRADRRSSCSARCRSWCSDRPAACSTRPAPSTPRPCSTATARSATSARTSAATTRSTRWSGAMLLAGELPATGLGLFVSGRASFEMVQKAWAAGFGTLVAVSAPTALAVDAARRARLARRVRPRRPLQRLRARTTDDAGIVACAACAWKPASRRRSTCSASRATPSTARPSIAAVKAAEAAELPGRHRVDARAQVPTSRSWRSRPDWRALRALQTALQRRRARRRRQLRVASPRSASTPRACPSTCSRERLYPQLPPEGKPAFCFYPMSKRREAHANWYATPFERAQRHDARARHERPDVRRPRRAAHHRLDRPRRLRVGRHAVRQRPRRHQGRRVHDALRQGRRRCTASSARSSSATSTTSTTWRRTAWVLAPGAVRLERVESGVPDPGCRTAVPGTRHMRRVRPW